MTTPTVLDIHVENGQLLARIERGDISAVVTVPEEFDRDELRETLDYVPGVLIQHSWQFSDAAAPAQTDGGDR